MKTINITLIVLAALVLQSAWQTASAQVADVCVQRFTDAGAVPGDPMCVNNAVLSPAGLSNFGCTARITTAQEFCSGPIPACPDGGVRNGADMCPVFDENRNADGSCRFGLARFSTNRCPPMPMLSDIVPEDQDIGSNAGCSGAQDNPLITLPGPVSSALEPLGAAIGSESGITGPLRLVSTVTLLNSLAVGVNVSSSAVEAQETGNSSRLFNNIYGLVLPLFGSGSVLADIFQTFSGFIDRNRNNNCP